MKIYKSQQEIEKKFDAIFPEHLGDLDVCESDWARNEDIKSFIRQIRQDDIKSLIEQIYWDDKEDRKLCLENQPEIDSQDIDDAYEIGWATCRDEIYKRIKALQSQLKEN
jgi:hypothetical protein